MHSLYEECTWHADDEKSSGHCGWCEGFVEK
jgi:hypothetical protein